jgi:hypothetical protein
MIFQKKTAIVVVGVSAFIFIIATVIDSSPDRLGPKPGKLIGCLTIVSLAGFGAIFLDIIIDRYKQLRAQARDRLAESEKKEKLTGVSRPSDEDYLR